MRRVTYARFRSLLAHAIEMTTPSGERVLLDRADIDDPNVLDFTDDAKVREYFHRDGVLAVVCTRVDQREKSLVARRFSFLSDPSLRTLLSYKLGQSLGMLITDTNAPLYAYGEIAPDVEGRCDKQAIRRLLQQRRVLPHQVPEGHPEISIDDLLSASPGDDGFWQLYYPAYELNPGDYVVGCVRGIDYDSESESYAIDLDLVGYLEILAEKQNMVFPWLGLEAAAPVQIESERALQAGQVEPSSGSASSPLSVLIVDDDVDGDLSLMSVFLTGEGFEVVTCCDEPRAKHAARQRRDSGDGKSFDVALIDVHLDSAGEGNDYRGLGFAHWLQKRMPQSAIILASAEDLRTGQGSKRDVASDLQVVEYVPKPILARELRDLIRSAPSRERVLASDLLERARPDQADAERSIAKSRRLRLDRIRTILTGLGRELAADNVAVFRMHKVSRAVTILAHAGERFPRYLTHRKGLRYSPVRNVCENKEAWCHNAVPRQWFRHHRKLLNICDPERPYTSCAACHVPEPPGDDHWYALFAFAFPASTHGGDAGTFRVRESLIEQLPAAQAPAIRDALTVHLMREYASYVAQHLLERWHEDVQLRQSPFLITGMATSSMGHDLANCLTGADQAVASMRRVLARDHTVSEGDLQQLGLLEGLTARAIGIADTFKKQARSRQERPSEVDLVKVIESACQAVMFEAERNTVELFYFGEPRLLLNCRRGVVERVLFNLLLNAVQQIGLSLRESGMIQVAHFLRDTAQGKEVVVQVYDNGTGIQGYRQNRIFNPGETSRAEGSGMGLAIVREELKKLGGSVGVCGSVLLGGSCFEMVLPPKTCAGMADEDARR